MMNQDNNQNYNNLLNNNLSDQSLNQNINNNYFGAGNGYNNIDIGNNGINNVPNKNKKRWLIILLVILVAVVVVILIVKFANTDGVTDNNVSDNKVNDELEEVPDIWVDYDDIDKYEFDEMIPLNLDDIEVIPQKITFISDGGKKGTLDFTSGDFFPSYFEMYGFKGQIYMYLKDEYNAEHYSDYVESNASVFNSLLKDGMSIEFYSVDKSKAYAICIVKFNDVYWVMGVNMESNTVEYAENWFKKLISMIMVDDEDALTIDEFLYDMVRKIEFNVKNISLNDVSLYGTGFDFRVMDRKIEIASFGSSYYSSYFYAKNGDVILNLCKDNSVFLNDNFKVKEMVINGSKVRIYRRGEDNQSFEYYVGLISENKEYVYLVQDITRYKENTEKDLVSLLNKLIK